MQTELIVGKFRAYLASRIREGKTFLAPLLPLSAEAALVRALAGFDHRTLVWITDGPQTLELAHRDLRTVSPPSTGDVLYFPAWEGTPGPDTKPDPDIEGNRLNTLMRIRNQVSGVSRVHGGRQSFGAAAARDCRPPMGIRRLLS